MAVLLIAAFSALSGAQSAFICQYNKKEHRHDWLFNMCFAVAAAFVFFTISLFESNFAPTFTALEWEVGGVYGITYALCFFGQINALQKGSIAFTELILSFSNVIPTLFGLIVFHDEPKPLFFVALAISVASLLVFGWPKKSELAEKKVTPIWIFYVACGFIGCGGANTIMAWYKRLPEGGRQNPFMTVSMLSALLIYTVLFLVSTKGGKAAFKNCALFGGAAGLSNGSLAAILLVILGMMSTSVAYPLISCASLIANFCVATFLFKEKATAQKIVGVSLGLLATVLFNL